MSAVTMCRRRIASGCRGGVGDGGARGRGESAGGRGGCLEVARIALACGGARWAVGGGVRPDDSPRQQFARPGCLHGNRYTRAHRSCGRMSPQLRSSCSNRHLRTAPRYRECRCCRRRSRDPSTRLLRWDAGEDGHDRFGCAWGCRCVSGRYRCGPSRIGEAPNCFRIRDCVWVAEPQPGIAGLEHRGSGAPRSTHRRVSCVRDDSATTR